jgi:hypothetical protein
MPLPLALPVAEVDRSVTESARFYQVKLKVHIVWKKFQPSAHDDRENQHLTLIDQTRSERVRRESRSTDQYIAVARRH